MKKLIALALSGFIAIQAAPSFAGEGKADHYEGAEIASTQQAVKVVHSGYNEIASIVNGGLNADNMERIHEITYEVEDAIAYLNKAPKLDMTDFSTNLEGVHLSSESNQPGLLKSYFKVLQKEAAKLFKAYPMG
ncbi:DUF6746 family protein [Terasakiella sp. A23]|uniref:DUF6746 family protein n=1 Tax=Terasakiella sp. FCG-A23 TaxID=3080561 RepID=UPI00295477F0|nr:DUF6746 family protein [Terasakiella sp. A23]MDV7337997.1 DUF6746 family protein [Terasakiella sp. A23]